MRRTLILIAALCLALLVTAAPASASISVTKTAAATCAKERKAIGRKAFTKKYGAKRTMQRCIRRTRPRVVAAQRQAEQECAEELAELGFAEFARGLRVRRDRLGRDGELHRGDARLHPRPVRRLRRSGRGRLLGTLSARFARILRETRTDAWAG